MSPKITQQIKTCFILFCWSFCFICFTSLTGVWDGLEIDSVDNDLNVNIGSVCKTQTQVQVINSSSSIKAHSHGENGLQ